MVLAVLAVVEMEEAQALKLEFQAQLILAAAVEVLVILPLQHRLVAAAAQVLLS